MPNKMERFSTDSGQTQKTGPGRLCAQPLSCSKSVVLTLRHNFCTCKWMSESPPGTVGPRPSCHTARPDHIEGRFSPRRVVTLPGGVSEPRVHQKVIQHKLLQYTGQVRISQTNSRELHILARVKKLFGPHISKPPTQQTTNR